MFSADELLEALRRRRTPKSIRPEEPGRLPPGWEQWLERMSARIGAVTGAPAPDYIAQLMERPLRAPPRAGAALTRWQAFGTMWRQQWHAAEPEERGLRIFAMATSLVVHACFAVLLAWLMYMHLLVLLAAPAGEAAVVQVEYLGTGTPEDAGGGALQVREDPAPVPRQASAPAAATPVVDPAPPSAPAQPPPVPTLPVEVATPEVASTVPPLPPREIPAPALPSTSQPLQVTEVDQPDIDFVLPPPTTEVDVVRQPELAVPTREVPAPEVIEAVEPELASSLPTVAVDVPETRSPVLALPQREVPAPEVAEVARLPQRAVPAPSVSIDAPEMAVPDVEVATIPAPPSRTTDASGAEASDPAAAEGAAADATADAATGERVAGEASDTAGAETPAGRPAADIGAGRETAAAPGGWPSPTRGDDWDDALQDRSGGQGGEGGVFDATGRPQLAGTGDRGPPGGAPPGSEARQAIDLEKGGSWLRRPPFDYRPTRFDSFWIPSGTLLEEWVRRGIKQMAIPIPGTSMEIVCVVSILQLGGGCGLRDPNVNEEPSTGRAAPDVPFKPELQDNQDALARPPGG